MPARGPVVVAYGQETAKGVSSKGITIKTRSEAQVISPFDGSVILPDRSAATEKLLSWNTESIICHCWPGWKTLTAKSDKCCWPGTDPDKCPKTTKPNFYVELRKDSRPIDPEAWIAK